MGRRFRGLILDFAGVLTSNIGLRLEDLPASGRLAGRTGQRVLDNLATAMKCRDLARMRTDVPVPTAPTGRPSPALPAPADVVTMLDLW